MSRTLFDTPVEAPTLDTTGWRFTPRDYQARGVTESLRLFDQGSKGVLIVQPTGTGKTIVGTMIADRWCQRSEYHRALICAHEIQLVEQFADEVEDVLGIRPGIEQAGNWADPDYDKIVVASRQTLMENESGNSRLYRFNPEYYHWLLICDEVHKWRWGLKTCRHIFEWFERFEHNRRLGLTATAERGDGVTLNRVAPDVAVDYRLYDVDGGPNAVNDGYAVPYDQRYVEVLGVVWKDIREVAGDFKKEDLETLLNKRETLLKLVKPTLDLVGDRRTIIFSPTRQMAKDVAHTINEFKPDSAESLDGTIPVPIRKQTYARHKAGMFQFLSVCNLCREGYNDPGIAAVAVYRPTKSKALKEQMLGRGCRPGRGVIDGLNTPEERRAAIAASDKPNCMIVDLVGITGMPDIASTAHVMASGKPDEVLHLADKIAQEAAADLQEGESVDVAECVQKAERQINEQAELRRAAQEEEERREAERLSKLNGEVTYSQRQVHSGQGGSREVQSRDGWRVPFGRNKGKLLTDISMNDLQWLHSKCKTPKWSKPIQNEMNRRVAEKSKPITTGGTAGANPNQMRVLKQHGFTGMYTFEEAARIIVQEINTGKAQRVSQ